MSTILASLGRSVLDFLRSIILLQGKLLLYVELVMSAVHWHWLPEFDIASLYGIWSAENVHAREGLACRKRVAPASSPAAPASSAQGSRRLRSTLVAAPGLLAHALVTK